MQKETEGKPAAGKSLKELTSLIHQVQGERDRSEHILGNLAKAQARMQAKATEYHETKLAGLYSAALQNGYSERDALKAALAGIHQSRDATNASKNSDGPKETLRRGALMKQLQRDARVLPLFVESKKVPPPPLCGAVPAEPNYVAKVDDMVAALVKVSPKEENWILAKVKGYNHNTNKYEIEDIDEEQKEKHVLSRKRVIPLPLQRAAPEINPDALFPKDTLVLALYPQTTCFYPAIVAKPPSVHTEEYQVLFEDKTYKSGYAPPLSVPQRYVLCYKEGRKK